MSDALIIRQADKLALNEGTAALREAALAQCALLNSCGTPEEQSTLVKAQQELKGVLNLLEKAREAAKKPLLEAGRALDTFVKSQSEELNAEGNRLAKLVNHFQEVQRIKAGAVVEASRKEQSELETLRANLLKEVKTVEEADAINEDISRRTAAAQQTAVAAAPVQARGQVVRDDWDITVANEFALAKFHPQCVTIIPKLAEIKILLNQGITVNGVKAEKKINSGVRAARVIEV